MDSVFCERIRYSQSPSKPSSCAFSPGLKRPGSEGDCSVLAVAVYGDAVLNLSIYGARTPLHASSLRGALD
jgi:hypothetical protein